MAAVGAWWRCGGYGGQVAERLYTSGYISCHLHALALPQAEQLWTD
jgi:hypothetical protein